MRLARFGWLAALALLGCTVGGDDELSSPYKNAQLEVQATTAVADGTTPVTVEVTGDPGTELTLVASGSGASFVAPDDTSPQQKTVFLGAEDGMATAAVVSTEARVVTVALKVERIRSAREISFEPVRFVVGVPQPVRLQPGQVVHDVCVAVNSSKGTLQADAISVEGSFSPVRVDVRDQMPTGLTCPTETVDEIGWHGYAAFTWGTAVDFAQVTLTYLGPEGSSLATDTQPLRGEAFTGYSVASGTPTMTESWTSIQVDISYPAIGPLPGGAASGVTLEDIRFIPESGPQFLGSSSGGAEDPAITDLTGRVVLFFDTEGAVGTFALFVTPQNGATVYLTDITVP